MGRSRLILVVGPSGAGKDALIQAAVAEAEISDPVHVARRVITREALPGAEDHDTVSEDAFRQRQAAGDFALWWGAHGLLYGIPASIEAVRAGGVPVIANVSRTVIDTARATLPPVGVVVVTASPTVLARRLAHRGRETAEDIERRLSRAAADLPQGDDVRVVWNDGILEDGVRAFIGACRSLTGA